VVAGIYRDVTRGQPADAARARMTAEALIRALEDTPAVLWRDTVARDHDELDPAHAVDTAVFAAAAGKGLGVSGADLVEIATAALLHDVGLFLLPADVRGTERTRHGPRPAWRHMTEGAYLLRDLSPDQSLPMVVALEHHGGSTVGGTVLPQSRLIGVADYVDALTAGRDPTRAESSIGEVLHGLVDDPGSWFAAAHIRALVEAFQGASASGVDLSEVL
ncbi:MAG: HD domain-containing protein, partial [bacterium]